MGHPRLHRGHLRVGCRWLEGTGSRNPGDDLTLHTRVRPASSEHRYEGCIRGPTAVTLSSLFLPLSSSFSSHLSSFPLLTSLPLFSSCTLSDSERTEEKREDGSRRRANRRRLPR